MSEESYEHWYDFGPGSEYAIHRAQEALQQSTTETSGLIAVTREWRDEAVKHIATLEAQLAAANDKVLRVVRGEFGQICSYCGWESVREGAQWDELQAHIKTCPQHPMREVERQLAAVTAERDAVTECLNGSSKARYTAKMYDALRKERDALRAALTRVVEAATNVLCPTGGFYAHHENWQPLKDALAHAQEVLECP